METIRTKNLELVPVSRSEATSMLASSVDAEERSILEAYISSPSAESGAVDWCAPFSVTRDGARIGILGFESAPKSGTALLRSRFYPTSDGSLEYEALRAATKYAFGTKQCYYIKASSPASNKERREQFVNAKFRLLKNESGTLLWQAEKPPSLLIAYLLYAGIGIGIVLSFFLDVNQLIPIAVCGIIGAAIGAVIDASRRKVRRAVTSSVSVQDKTTSLQALKLMQKNNLSNMCAMEAVRRGNGDILSVKGVSVLLRENRSGAYHFVTEDSPQALRFADQVASPKVVLAYSEPCAAALSEKYGFENKLPCVSFIYMSQYHLPVDPSLVIRPLEPSDFETVAQCLGDTDSGYVQDRLESGNIFGAFLDGTLVGFGGYCITGSIGMINVFPAYRRLGYGSSIEAFLVNRDVDAGRTPFCLVPRENDAASSMQEKLGLQSNYKTLSWLF